MKATEKLWRNGKSLVGKRDGKTSTAKCLLQVPTIVGLIPTTPPFISQSFLETYGYSLVCLEHQYGVSSRNGHLVEKRRFQSYTLKELFWCGVICDSYAEGRGLESLYPFRRCRLKGWKTRRSHTPTRKTLYSKVWKEAQFIRYLQNVSSIGISRTAVVSLKPAE